MNIFSSQHVSGIQLALYTGVAAILRDPLMIPDEEVQEVQEVVAGSSSSIANIKEGSSGTENIMKVFSTIELEDYNHNDIEYSKFDESIADMMGNITINNKPSNKDKKT